MYSYVYVHREALYVYSMLYTVLAQRISSDQEKLISFYKFLQILKRLKIIYLNIILPDNFLSFSTVTDFFFIYFLNNGLFYYIKMISNKIYV